MARLHHVGIIFPDEDLVREICEFLDLELDEEHRQFVPEYEADCHFTKRSEGSCIEFIVAEKGKLSEFNKGMGGLHHIAIAVDSLAETEKRLAEKGVEFLEKDPVDAGRLLINFVSPVYTRGIIVEFVEDSSA